MLESTLALIILGEIIAVALLFYGYLHEDKVIEWEDRQIESIKNYINSNRKKRGDRV